MTCPHSFYRLSAMRDRAKVSSFEGIVVNHVIKSVYLWTLLSFNSKEFKIDFVNFYPDK